MSKQKRENKIIVSLTSSAVELSVVEFSTTTKILFFKKVKLLIQNQLSSKEFIDKSFSALSKLLVESLLDIKIASTNIDACEIIFHPPWFLPEIVYVKNTMDKVSLKKFFIEKTRPPKQNDYKQIENKVTNIMVNGYHLTTLRDIECKDLEINIYRSYVSKETLALLLSEIKKRLPQIRNINFSSSVMMFYESIKELFVDEDNVIFLNIGGEITEIGIIVDDVLVSVLTIPTGSHNFARKLDTFTSSQKNLGILKFLGDKKSDEKIDIIKDAKIINFSRKWFDDVLDTIKSSYMEFPKKFFIFSSSEYLDFFKMILESNYNGFNFTIINHQMFDNKVIFDKMSKQDADSLLSAYYLSIKN